MRYLLLAMSVVLSLPGCGTASRHRAADTFITPIRTQPLQGEETRTVTVPANLAWQNSEMFVSAGDTVTVMATGSWTSDADLGKWTGPDGTNSGVKEVPEFPVMALLGRLNEGRPFLVGSAASFVAKDSGYLYFGCNNKRGFLGNNQGNLILIVAVNRVREMTADAGGGIPETKAAATGVRPRIAVITVKPPRKAAARGGYSDAVSEMLTTAFIKTGRFEVLERSQAKQLLNERRLAEMGIAAAESAISIGKILEAKYLVIGSAAKLGNLIEVDVRFVDTESGKALIAENASCHGMENLRNTISSIVNKISIEYNDRLTHKQ